MKTAMQELMEILEAKILLSDNNNEYMNAMNAANNNIIYYIKKEFLEKEKEQIIDAYEDGYEACDLDEVMEVNKRLTSGDLYYNMNYNQNK